MLNNVNSKVHQHNEFDKAKNYVNILMEKLISIEKISSRINKEQSELVSELNNYYPIFTTWSASEPQLAHILLKISRAFEKSTAAQNSMISNYNSLISIPIKEFLQYVDVVNETLMKRDAYQAAYNNSYAELAKRRVEKDKVEEKPCKI